MASIDRTARYASAARRGSRAYKRAFSANGSAGLGEESEFVAQAVMAVADNELNELRGKIAALMAEADAEPVAVDNWYGSRAVLALVTADDLRAALAVF